MSYEKDFFIIDLTPKYNPVNGAKLPPGDNPPIIETIKMEIEPYSSGQAELQYGQFGSLIKVTNRMFCDPTPNLKLGSKGKYKNRTYQVTGLMDYDEHYEVLLELIV